MEKMNLWFDATMFFLSEMQYGCENFSRSKRFLSLQTYKISPSDPEYKNLGVEEFYF